MHFFWGLVQILIYIKRSVAVVERKMKVLRNKEIPLVKVSGNIEEAPSGPGSRRRRYGSIILSYLQHHTLRMKSSSIGCEL